MTYTFDIMLSYRAQIIFETTVLFIHYKLGEAGCLCFVSLSST